MIPEKIKKLLDKEKVIFFTTSSKKSIPNAVAVESCGIHNDKILIADCHLGKTAKNLKENNKVAILITDNKEYYQIKGTAEYLTSGEYFDKVTKICDGTNYVAKAAVLVSCQEVYDLNTYIQLL